MPIRTSSNKEQYWDADKWLSQFIIAGKNGDTRPLRAEVFRSTVEIVNNGQYISYSGKSVPLKDYITPNATEGNMFYFKEVPANRTEIRKYDTTIRVVEDDCLAFAQRLLLQDSKDDLCVLNMASPHTPGGGVYGGAGAQEEYLFRCSDYYRFLFQYSSTFSPQSYGITPHPTFCYPLNDNFGGIFSKGITVFRSQESEGYALLDSPWKVNAIAVAAVDVRHHRVAYNEYHSLMLNKIRTIFRIAFNNGQRRLVLGAFGCGAFGNDPYIVAALFRQVLDEPEFNGAFREIYFPIIEDHNSKGRNVQAFSSIFK